MKKKVAIIGATGMLGKPVTKQLMAAGFDVSILARNVKKTAEIFPSIPVIEADVFDPLSLVKALEHQEIVYISLGPDRNARKNNLMPEREGLENIIDAARHCGIKRIALLSSLVQNYNGINNFNWWIFTMKQLAVTKIRSCGVPYSIFYPSTFMESVHRDVISGNKLLLITRSIAPMWFISGEDYGRQVAKALTIAGNSNQEYIIQGPEPFTWDEAAKVIIDNYNKPLKLMKAPIAILKFAGLFSGKMNYAAHICEALNKYPEKFECEKTWQELGKPEVTLARYIQFL